MAVNSKPFRAPKAGRPGAKMSAKAIPPSYKPRERYLHFEVLSPEGTPAQGLSERDVSFSVNSAVISFLGQVGFAAASPRLVSFDPQAGAGVLKCNLESLEFVRSALLFLTEVSQREVVVNVLRASGTIKALKGR
ncbi:MAG TPA: Rpp14/Pop5 family protein [archaeon]|nr:Rpp14/Pop5 family protein [archaeon]